MQRRVNKEKKKRDAQRKADEEARRKQIENMDQGMVRQFTHLQSMKKAMTNKVTGESKKQLDLADKLKQMLKEWQHKVENSQAVRGENIWELDEIKKEQDKEKAAVQAEKEAMEDKGRNMEYTLVELYRRIRKVESLSIRLREVADEGAGYQQQRTIMSATGSEHSRVSRSSKTRKIASDHRSSTKRTAK